MSLKQIPLRQLRGPVADPIRPIDPAWVAALKPSLSLDGVLRPFIAYEAPGNRRRATPMYCVIDGRHRLQALLELAGGKDSSVTLDTKVAVNVQPEPQARALALAVALLEKPLKPVEQWRAFARLVDEHGMSPDEACAHLGWPTRKLEQMTSLGRLHEFILRAFEAGQIGLEAAQAYTRERVPARQWKLFNALRETDSHGKAEAIRRATAEKRIDPAVAIFDLAAAKIAIGRDLFGTADDDPSARPDKSRPWDGSSWIEDTRRFWIAQRDAAVARGEALKAEGWGEVQVVENDGDPFAMGRGLALVPPDGHLGGRVRRLTKQQRGFGRAIVHIAPDGRVTEALYILQNRPEPAAAEARPSRGDAETRTENADSQASPREERDSLRDSEAPSAESASASDARKAERAGPTDADAAARDKSPYPAKIRSELRTIKSLMLQHALVARDHRSDLLGLVVAAYLRRDGRALQPHPCRRALDPRHPLSGTTIAMAVREDTERAWECLRHYVPDDFRDGGRLTPEQLGELVMMLPADEDGLWSALGALVASTIGYEPGPYGGVQGPHRDDGWLDQLGACCLIQAHEWWRPTREWLTALPKAALAEIIHDTACGDWLGTSSPNNAAVAAALFKLFCDAGAGRCNEALAERLRTWVPEPLRFFPWPPAAEAEAPAREAKAAE